MSFFSLDFSLVRLNNRVAAAALTLACAVALAPAGARAWLTINNPLDSTFNQLLGINNSGLISGYYGTGNAGDPNQGYLVTTPVVTFTPWNYPSSAQTQVTGLNNTGVTVGFWSNTNNGPPLDANFGWYYKSGSFVNVNNPSTPTTGVTTNQLLGVNDSDIAVGFYNDAAGNSHGYTYNINTATFSAVINDPAASSTVTAAINNAGVIAGFDTNAGTGALEGFIDKGGTFTEVVAPFADETATALFGINNKGIAVGDWTNAAGNTYGLIFNSVLDTFVSLNDPFGNGTMTVFNGLNEKNQIVGFYLDAQGNTDGLLLTIPEPATWALALLGFGGLAFAAARRSVRFGSAA